MASPQSLSTGTSCQSAGIYILAFRVADNLHPTVSLFKHLAGARLDGSYCDDVTVPRRKPTNFQRISQIIFFLQCRTAQKCISLFVSVKRQETILEG